MVKLFKYALALSVSTVALGSAANAAVITSLPGGTAVPIPVLNVTHVSTPHVLAPGIVANPSGVANFTPGYTGGYGFSSNGSWSGTSMIGLDTQSGYFTIDFANPISAFLGELNWTTSFFAGDSVISIYGASGLLESLTLEAGGANAVAPGFWGFSRSAADITSVRFENEYIGVRNISIISTAAVPEPATWGMMILGFGMMGAAMRRRRQQVRVTYA